MNISTNGSLVARAIDCRMYAACVEYGTPSESSGRVWWPYSVTQIGTDLRLNHFFRFVVEARKRRERDVRPLHDLRRAASSG